MTGSPNKFDATTNVFSIKDAEKTIENQEKAQKLIDALGSDLNTANRVKQVIMKICPETENAPWGLLRERLDLIVAQFHKSENPDLAGLGERLEQTIRGLIMQTETKPTPPTPGNYYAGVCLE